MSSTLTSLSHVLIKLSRVWSTHAAIQSWPCEFSVNIDACWRRKLCHTLLRITSRARHSRSTQRPVSWSIRSHRSALQNRFSILFRWDLPWWIERCQDLRSARLGALTRKLNDMIGRLELTNHATSAASEYVRWRVLVDCWRDVRCKGWQHPCWERSEQVTFKLEQWHLVAFLHLTSPLLCNFKALVPDRG